MILPMKSSRVSILVLLFLVGMVACVAEGYSDQETIVGSKANAAGKEAMNGQTERVMIPSILMDHSSPLDSKTTALYASKIKDGSIAQHAKDFCSEAKLLCDADVNILDPGVDISLKELLERGDPLQRAKDVIEASKAMFFNLKDLEVGKDIKISASLQDQYPTTSFLPESLAKILPMSGDKIAELLQMLAIPPNSNLAIMMSRTLAQCEEKANPTGLTAMTEESPSMCVTSLETLTKFLGDHFPLESRIKDLDRTILASTDSLDSAASNCDITPCTEGNCTHQSPSEPTVTCVPGNMVADAEPSNRKTGTNTLKVLDVKEHEHTVVCHKNVFPFAVYECHNIDSSKSNAGEESVKIYAVALESHEDGRPFNQIASCRADVGVSQNPRKALIPSLLTNEPSACHWLSDTFVWAPVPAV